MTGKVFNDTTNIYQDQAKVLFDYYRAAAEKIVSEEMSLERQNAELQKQILDADTAIKKDGTKLYVSIGIIALFLIIGAVTGILILMLPSLVGVFLGIKALSDKKSQKKAMDKYAMILDRNSDQYVNIKRDYSISKMGVAYIPVATRVPFEDKSFLIDHTGSVGSKEFTLNLLHNPKEFQDAVGSLQGSLEKMPIIDSNTAPENINTSDYSLSMQNVTLHDYAGNIDRQIRNVNYLLNDSEDVSISIPAIEAESDAAEYLKEFATTDTGNNPVVEVFDTSFEDELESFNKLHSSREQFDTGENTNGSDYLKNLMLKLAESVQLMSKVKNSGSSRLNEYTSGIFSLVMKAGYNQYSPSLEAEAIERIRASKFDYKTSVGSYIPFSLKKSSSVKYDLFTRNWVAEDGSRTVMPFGVHQVDEEVLMPVIENLMEENRIERLNIYSSIDDQKRVYLDRWSSEINSYFRDNRQAADELINRMRETYADFANAQNMYKSLLETSNMMKNSGSVEDAEVNEMTAEEESEMLAGFEKQAEGFNEQMESFTDYMDRIMEEINKTTDEFAHIEYYEGSLRDSVSKKTADAMANVRELSDRQKMLLKVSPYLASFAELPPEPNYSEEVYMDAGMDIEEQARAELDSLDNGYEESSNASDFNAEDNVGEGQ